MCRRMNICGAFVFPVDMQEKDFPSGPWTGFYQYRTGERGDQDLHIEFRSGRMTGSGADALGAFIIEGSYNTGSKEARWMKSYPQGHSIEYRGFREGPAPGIWGTWTISTDWTGGFHIWPLDASSGSQREVLEMKLPLQVGSPERAYELITSETARPMRPSVRD